VRCITRLNCHRCYPFGYLPGEGPPLMMMMMMENSQNRVSSRVRRCQSMKTKLDYCECFWQILQEQISMESLNSSSYMLKDVFWSVTLLLYLKALLSFPLTFYSTTFRIISQLPLAWIRNEHFPNKKARFSLFQQQLALLFLIIPSSTLHSFSTITGRDARDSGTCKVSRTVSRSKIDRNN
jgi:hypothetical protein